MVTRAHASFPVACTALACTLGGAACISPPPETAGAVEEPDTPAAAEARSDLRPLVLWDGAKIRARNVGVGRSGRMQFWDGGAGWASCDAKPDCKASLAVAPRAGFTGHKGLKFHAEGPGWIGTGWSWFDWYPPTAGSDLSGYARLSFRVRVDAASPADAPDPANVTVSLVCSRGKKGSARVPLQKYDASFADGAWHRVEIPLADLREGAQATGFDPTTVWEFRLSTWSAAPRRFDAYIDQITAEN